VILLSNSVSALSLSNSVSALSLSNSVSALSLSNVALLHDRACKREHIETQTMLANQTSKAIVGQSKQLLACQHGEKQVIPRNLKSEVSKEKRGGGGGEKKKKKKKKTFSQKKKKKKFKKKSKKSNFPRHQRTQNKYTNTQTTNTTLTYRRDNRRWRGRRRRRHARQWQCMRDTRCHVRRVRRKQGGLKTRFFGLSHGRTAAHRLTQKKPSFAQV
jgi:hypothetical protein